MKLAEFSHYYHQIVIRYLSWVTVHLCNVKPALKCYTSLLILSCRLSTAPLLLSLLSLATATTLEAETCDPKRMMVDVNYANADVILGGLFDLREPSNNYGCGTPDKGLLF